MEESEAERGDRVSVNVQTGEVTYRFSTPEEIRQMNENHKLHLLEEQKTEERQKLRNKIISDIKYENRVVIFLDVLGWGKIVEESGKTEDTELLKQIADIAYNAKDMSEQLNSTGSDPFDTRITHFSDSLVISLPEVDMYPQRIEFFLFGLISAALHGGMFIRGGIAFGKIYHNNNMIFGPALNRAYELESKIAKFPRIIMDSSVCQLCDERSLSDGWKKIEDEYYFFDFINQLTSFTWDSAIRINEENVKLIKKTIEIGLHDFSGDDKILSKYCWLARYYNDTVSNDKIQI